MLAILANGAASDPYVFVSQEEGGLITFDAEVTPPVAEKILATAEQAGIRIRRRTPAPPQRKKPRRLGSRGHSGPRVSGN
jgi:hypothetical protein